MAKSIIMKVMTSLGYEPMYPFNPGLVMNATVENTSTTSNFNLTISPLPSLDATLGNQMGIICFIPTTTNVANATITLNSGTALPIVFSTGTPITANILTANVATFVKYYNNQFYLIMDKNQVGLSNVNNTADLDKPVSTATQTALDSKLNIPQLIPANTNLNSYQTAGLYYNATSSEVSTMTNIPIAQPFSLFIERHSGVKQTFTAYMTGGIQSWSRNYYNGTWGSWQQMAYVSYGTGDPNPNNGLDGNIYIKISS